MSKPDLVEQHVRANVPGTTVHMVHIADYGILDKGKNRKMHLGTIRIVSFMCGLHSMCLADMYAPCQ